MKLKYFKIEILRERSHDLSIDKCKSRCAMKDFGVSSV